MSQVYTKYKQVDVCIICNCQMGIMHYIIYYIYVYYIDEMG